MVQMAQDIDQWPAFVNVIIILSNNETNCILKFTAYSADRYHTGRLKCARSRPIIPTLQNVPVFIARSS
jgi:hypothetical protein